MKHVIIGTGAAGISAAKTIRENTNDEIVMIAADEAVYSRCMLHKYIGGARNVAELSFIPDDFFVENNIIWRGNTTVTAINTKAKRVGFDSGWEDYDRLLIATGSNSALPPIEGLRDAKNVFGLRHLQDAKDIRQHAEHASNIVIIGAGLVGLDVAYGLIEMGKKPTVIERAEAVLSQNMDTCASSVYQSKFADAGCTFMLGSTVVCVITESNGAVAGVKLEDGQILDCDLLVVAVGVQPAIGFLAGSGIETARGIKVDNYFATNVPDIYAAGDATGVAESWPDAVHHGEVAAYNMCGIVTEFDETHILKNTVNFFDTQTICIGEFLPEPGDVEEIRTSADLYQKVILRNGVPIGVVLQGEISHSGFWQHMIRNQVSVENISKPIWKISFADTYGMREDGEYQWV